jgi:eukaryotic-like serine/threonine-protein kinase
MPARQDRSVKTADASAPEEFGPYIVYERLGVGGMATVHRAKKRGIAGFERGVALKRMLPHLAEDAEFINSFVREAKLASLLVHPNIAQIYDFGRVGNVYYIAMEHVDGFDVRKMLRYSNRHKEPLPLNVVMSIMSELCDALEYAHTFVDEHGQPQGIVHRDVSPSNLIIAQSGHLKVIDFGIAKANVRQLHTESGRVKGKLGYMSPEAVSGRAFGPVSDVFSAGVVAHELLTAHPLFSAKTDYDTLIRIHEAEIPPPSRRNPGVPASLDEVVLAALSRDPERRLQTAGAFREALEYVADQSGVRFSARDVAEWRAKIATTEDPWGQRTSLPNVSSSAVSRAFPFPESSRNTLSGTHQRPLPPEPIVNSPPLLRPSQEHRARPVTSVGEPQHDEDKSAVEMPWGADPNQPLHHVLPDQAVPPPQMVMPAAAPAPASRRNLAARLALIVLFMIAAGLAVYQFVLRPKKPPPAPPPAVATLKFDVQPTDAIVEIGGKEHGRSSPFEIKLDPGVYTIAVRRQGYKNWSTEVTLRDAEKQTVRVALERGVAQVSVTSQPPGLVVTLDGKQLEQVTPIEFQTQAGPHQLVVTNAAGTTWPMDFTAEIDGKYTFHAPLTAPTKKGPAAAVRTPQPERATERAPDRTPERVTERAPDRTPERAGDRPGKRGVVASRNGRDSVELPEPTPPPKQPDEPPPPPKQPDAGVPAVAQEPPRSNNPVAPTGPRAPPLVAVNTVTKLSGDIPQIRANVTEPFTDVTGKLCIGTDGHVTSARILKALPEIVDELQRALMGWRYRPYVNSAGQSSPACFALTLRVVFKRSN